MFDPISLMTSGLSFVGGLMKQSKDDERIAAQNRFNAEQAVLNREFNAAEAEKSRQFSREESRFVTDFQERMSNSAFQRSMADMSKAGLNPILAYQKGGASSPSGAMASTSAASGSAASGSTLPASDVLGPAVSTAMQRERLTQELDNMRSTNANLKLQGHQIVEQTINTAAQTNQINADTRIKDELLQAAQREASKAKTDEDFYNSWPGRILRTIGTGLRELNPFMGRSGGVGTPAR